MDFADPTFPVSLVEKDDPTLPTGEWALCRVVRGGICGSDTLLLEATSPNPLLARFVGLPMELGHEIGAVVEEPGADFPLPAGTRVAIDPVIACAARGITPPCGPCSKGTPSCCEHLASRRLTPGFALGYTNGLGAGWADLVTVHSSMAYPLPPGVPESASSLAEPLSVAVHGILSNPPPSEGYALVIGCGIVGLAAVATLRYLFPELFVVALARYPHQAELAEDIGANAVVMGRDEKGNERGLASVLEEMAQLLEDALISFGDAAILRRGFDYVVEAAGSTSSVRTSLASAAPRSTVLLLGVVGSIELDMTTVWLKELRVAGSFCHGYHRYGDRQASSIEIALEMLAAGRIPDRKLISATFPLREYKQALRVAVDHRGTGSTKVVFDPAL